MRYATFIIIGVLVVFSAGGCGDDESLYGMHQQGRSVAEDRLAEEVEALLPGTWRWQNVSTEQGADLSINFLGRDAVTGDVALLIQTGAETDLHPARVLIYEHQAIIHFPRTDSSYSIERIAEDHLALEALDSSDRLIYRRVR